MRPASASLSSALLWKAFAFDGESYLFHVPSSSILQVSRTLWQRVRSGDEFPVPPELNVVKRNALSEGVDFNITGIALNVAERCNLRCTYCYAVDGTYGNDSLMSFDTAIRAIRFFKKHGQTLNIIFFGGEPLLNFRLIREVVEWCGKEEGYRFSLTTNGALLTKTHLDFFRTHDFALRISYDGRRLQEEQRTRDAKLAALIEAKLIKFRDQLTSLRRFHLRATIRRASLDYFLESTMEILSSHTYRLLSARVASLAREERFQASDVKKLGRLLSRLVAELVECENWETLLRLGNIRRHVRNFELGRDEPFCGAGINYLSVSTQGEFFLCHRFTEDQAECAGSLHTGLNQEYLRRIAEHRTGKAEPCGSCWMRNFCKGGCFHEHKMATGHIAKIDPLFCKLQDLEMKLALRVFVAMKKKVPAQIPELLHVS